jgi:hypothetical protein
MMVFLELGKQYDIAYRGGGFDSQFVECLRDILIIGYVGNDHDESVSKMDMRARWLVVEFPVGRRSYLQPLAIVSLPEAIET